MMWGLHCAKDKNSYHFSNDLLQGPIRNNEGVSQ